MRGPKKILFCLYLSFGAITYEASAAPKSWYPSDIWSWLISWWTPKPVAPVAPKKNDFDHRFDGPYEKKCEELRNEKKIWTEKEYLDFQKDPAHTGKIIFRIKDLVIDASDYHDHQGGESLIREQSSKTGDKSFNEFKAQSHSAKAISQLMELAIAVVEKETSVTVEEIPEVK